MIKKTNAMRLCDQQKVFYEVSVYEVNDGFVDGITVADLIKKPYDHVFKTLVTIGKTGQIYVFVIPVDQTLDLKKAATTFHEKSLQMLALTELNRATGYVKGGCSPIGMKKNYPICFDSQIKNIQEITFNAGKIGQQLTVNVADLEKVISYKIENIVTEEGV